MFVVPEGIKLVFIFRKGPSGWKKAIFMPERVKFADI